ncbi:MAG: O-antigen ligase family protein [Ardenticatenaceae bacterium]|nr:O-antigen ligase family protein [Ardenticatenaceae bacterium]
MSSRHTPFHLWVSLSQTSFTLFISLTFLTPSWRDGPFRWWPLWHAPLLAGAPVTIGLFNLLPLWLGSSWLVHRLINRSHLPRWQWGSRGLTLPMLGLTLLGLLSLEPELTRRTFTQAGGLALFWLIYLFVINERPSLLPPLLLIIASQSLVAITQFGLQKDLGLTALGELPLNPAFEGITVLAARGQPWLRAYGLTAHPNLLGAMLTMLLLWLLPSIGRQRGWRQGIMLLVFSLGLLGLFVSFSRSAWLAFGLGLVIWYLVKIQNHPSGDWPNLEDWANLKTANLFTNSYGSHKPLAPSEMPIPSKRPFPHRQLLPLIPLLLLFLFNYDLVLSRLVDLNSPLELTSLNQRLTDGRLALHIIAQQPWQGVGLGHYEQFAQNLNPDAHRVHNVPLYVTAELGLLAALFWLWLMLTPFVQWRQQALGAGFLAAWTAMLLMNMFDTMVWWSSNWQTAVLFALLTAQTSQQLRRTA